MDDLSLYSSEKVYYSFTLAGLGSRFIGFLLDNLIITGVYLGLGFFGFLCVRKLELWPETLKTMVIVFIIIMFFFVGLGYFIFFETIWNGQTPGKKAAGLRVVRKSGEAVTFSNILVRNLMRIIDLLPGQYAVGIIAILFSRAHQRVGDMVADTVVIKEKEIGEPLLFDSSQADPALTVKIRPYIYLIDEQDFGLIREYFNRQSQLMSDQTAPLAGKIAHHLAKKMGLEPAEAVDPVVFLRTVGALFRER